MQCPSGGNVSVGHGIVRDMRGADARDFHDFVVAGSPALIRLARMLSPDPHAGEDLLQATLLKAWSAWPRVRRADNPDAYVRRVMINLATKSRLRRWRGELATATLPESPGRDDHTAVDDRDALVHAVRQLPARQRTAVVLRYFADLDDAAIADSMGCSVATVRSQISRALASLRVSSVDAATPAKESS
jgi:RNA polymerase sigma-70 factor (sigma-E family)